MSPNVLALNIFDDKNLEVKYLVSKVSATNVIAVKEYSPVPEDTDEADLVFIHVNGTVASSWLKHKNYIHASK